MRVAAGCAMTPPLLCAHFVRHGPPTRKMADREHIGHAHGHAAEEDDETPMRRLQRESVMNTVAAFVLWIGLIRASEWGKTKRNMIFGFCCFA